MEWITVWTKQNDAVMDALERDGRFLADERFMRLEMEDTSDIMFFIYRWLAKHMPTQDVRPGDARYPVWVSLSPESRYPRQEGYVIMELRVPETYVARLDINKWTQILNYSYIPKDAEDDEKHKKLLTDYAIDDVRAVMTPFYPQIRQQILKSWERLFDASVTLGGAGCYGLLWEVRKEWIVRTVRGAGAFPAAGIPAETAPGHAAGSRGASPRTFTLYSPQAQIVCDVINRDGVAFSRRDYVRQKYEESAPVFLTAYDAYVREAVHYAAKPEGAEYPYWAFLSKKDLDASGGGQILTLRVPSDEIVFFDMFDWYKILRLSFLGETEEEEEAFSRELEQRGIRDSGNILLTAFYPDLKRRILNSWKRLFRHDAAVRTGDFSGVRAVQAGLWRIRKEWIV